MYGSHFHGLAHLYFKLLHNILFCTANFLLRGSISNGTNFWSENTFRDSPIHRNKLLIKILKRLYPHLLQCGAYLLDGMQYKGKQPKWHPDSFLSEVFDLLLSYIFHLLDPKSKLHNISRMNQNTSKLERTEIQSKYAMYNFKNITYWNIIRP